MKFKKQKMLGIKKSKFKGKIEQKMKSNCIKNTKIAALICWKFRKIKGMGSKAIYFILEQHLFIGKCCFFL